MRYIPSANALYHLSFLYLTLVSLKSHCPLSPLQPVKNTLSPQTEQKKVRINRATKVSAGTESTEGKKQTNGSTVSVKGGRVMGWVCQLVWVCWLVLVVVQKKR